MQYLIATADRSLNDDGAGNLVDFVRVKRDESIQRRQLKPKKPPPPEAPPEQPPNFTIPTPAQGGVSILLIKSLFRSPHFFNKRGAGAEPLQKNNLPPRRRRGGKVVAEPHNFPCSNCVFLKWGEEN